MTLQIKALLAAIVLTAVAALGFYTAQRTYAGQLAAEKAKSAEAIEASRSLTKELELHRVLGAQKNAATARLARSRAIQETRTAAALAQNPGWATQPIPLPVLEAMNAPFNSDAGGLGADRLRDSAPESGATEPTTGPAGGLPGQTAPAEAEPGPGEVHPGARAGTGELQRGQEPVAGVPREVGPLGDGP